MFGKTSLDPSLVWLTQSGWLFFIDRLVAGWLHDAPLTNRSLVVDI